MERNSEKIIKVMERREKISFDITIIEPKVREMQKKKETIREILDDVIMKTDNMYLTH